MRSTLLRVVLVAMIGLLAAPAGADTIFRFAPAVPDLSDLPHEANFRWEVRWDLPADQYVVGAALTIRQIWDNSSDADDTLHIRLLDQVSTLSSPQWRLVTVSGSPAYTYFRRVLEGVDSDAGDEFAGATGGNLPLLRWTDPYGGSTGDHAVDLVIPIPVENLGWLGDGSWAFGIDPDCHYLNDGFEFSVVTRDIPEPTSLMLVGVGLAAMGTAARRRRWPTSR